MDIDLPSDGAGPSSPRKGTKTIYVPENNNYTASVQPAFDYHSLDGTDPVICIDNGSHSWRAGFNTMSTPYIDRPNIVSRYKERKQNRNVLLFGNDTDADASSRANVRGMFDGDLLIHGDILENALDYTFLTLGIDSSSIEQPVLMTERLANPLFTRAVTSEMLFELYNCPSVTYGLDSLFAFSLHNHQDGLAISMGHNATTVIPVADGRGILSRAKRIPWGGAQAVETLLRLAQLKYPSFPVKVTPPQATFMYHETCYFSSNYEDDLRSLENPENMAKLSTIVQFPFTQPETVEKTDAEIAAALERRREQGKRLQEMQARQRAEKLAAKMVELEEYKTLLAERPNLKKPEFLTRLQETTPFETEAELESWIKKTESDIRRRQKKEAGEDIEPEEEPSFPLVDRPDEELTEEEVKEKRRQRLMKAGWEARVKAREEKKRHQEAREEEKRQEESERATDLDGWASRLRSEQEAVITRLQERKKRRAQFGNRKSMASQSRMKSLASLAADDNTKKRKKGDGGCADDDGFGMDDSDWMVYREISGEDESDAEEEDQTQLQSIETRLLQYDPTFTESDTMQGQAHAKNALINSFVRGGSDGKYEPEDLRQSHQLHLNVERIRVPEAWFQPSMFALDCAGLGEVGGWLLNGFEEDQRKRMMQSIVVTGGSAVLPNLHTRLRNTLTPLLPFRAPLKILSSPDGEPRLDAWKGMAKWATTEDAKTARVTRAEYEEYGGEWVKEHPWGNVAI